MRKLKIILDVDDTLMACLEPAVDIVRESTGYDLRYEDITEWNFLNFPEPIRKAMFSVISSNEYMLQQTPFPGAVELVDLLQEKGHEVIIFSAVPPGTMDARAKMILKYFNIPKQNIVLGGHKDAMYADIMLDDALHNILYSKCRYPILIRRPWNEKEKQVLSVRTYEEFIRMVDKIADAPQSKAMPTTEYGKPGFVAIVGPISSGKTSLVDLIVRDPRFCLTTAVTTRNPRDDDRKDEYHYVSEEQFECMSGRENRWMSDVNHQITKTLVSEYGKGSLFVIEDLTGISFADENQRSADGNRDLHSWAFYQFERYLNYKAKRMGSEVLKVSPKYTSQRCPKCGRIHKANRHHDTHEYVCDACGYRTNDDRSGAMNIQFLGTLYASGDTNPRFGPRKTN